MLVELDDNRFGFYATLYVVVSLLCSSFFFFPLPRPLTPLLSFYLPSFVVVVLF